MVGELLDVGTANRTDPLKEQHVLLPPQSPLQPIHLVAYCLKQGLWSLGWPGAFYVYQADHGDPTCLGPLSELKVCITMLSDLLFLLYS